MLDTHCKRKAEAEDMYRRAIVVEPNHAYGLYNLAVLLEEKTSSMKNTGNIDENTYQSQMLEVESFYRRAVQVDASDATTMADYGRFLLMKLEDIKNAEAVLKKAVAIDVNHEVALFHLGMLHARYTNKHPTAEEYFRKVLSKNPKHVACSHNLARLLIDNMVRESSVQGAGKSAQRRDELMTEAMDLYEGAIAAADDVRELTYYYDVMTY
jgi:tetratricopeptide (TPR) repeat protein